MTDTDTPVTAFGTASGVAVSLAGDHGPVPTRFVAATCASYATPKSRPVIA